MKLWIGANRAPAGYVHIKSVDEAKDVIMFAEEQYAKRAERCYDCSDYKIEVIDLGHDMGDHERFGGNYINLLNWLRETDRCYPIHIHPTDQDVVETTHQFSLPTPEAGKVKYYLTKEWNSYAEGTSMPADDSVLATITAPDLGDVAVIDSFIDGDHVGKTIYMWIGTEWVDVTPISSEVLQPGIISSPSMKVVKTETGVWTSPWGNTIQETISIIRCHKIFICLRVGVILNRDDFIPAETKYASDYVDAIIWYTQRSNELKQRAHAATSDDAGVVK